MEREYRDRAQTGGRRMSGSLTAQPVDPPLFIRRTAYDLFLREFPHRAGEVNERIRQGKIVMTEVMS